MAYLLNCAGLERKLKVAANLFLSGSSGADAQGATFGD
jgi:hypothetical protein